MDSVLDDGRRRACDLLSVRPVHMAWHGMAWHVDSNAEHPWNENPPMTPAYTCSAAPYEAGRPSIKLLLATTMIPSKDTTGDPCGLATLPFCPSPASLTCIRPREGPPCLTSSPSRTEGQSTLAYFTCSLDLPIAVGIAPAKLSGPFLKISHPSIPSLSPRPSVKQPLSTR